MKIKTKLKIPKLTPREHQILRMMCAGNQSKMIAHDLGISIRTVEFHRARLREKLLPDVTYYTGEQLGIIAYRLGLLDE
ncbi:MAG: LuxR C-terminal-related transcriptional regulator [Beijerinckiaceae bacterium]